MTAPKYLKPLVINSADVDHKEWLPTVERADKPVAPKVARNIKGRTFGKRGA